MTDNPRDIDTDAEVQELLDRGIGHDPNASAEDYVVRLKAEFEDRDPADEGPMILIGAGADEDNPGDVIVKMQVTNMGTGREASLGVAEMLEDIVRMLRSSTVSEVSQEEADRKLAEQSARAAHPAGKRIAPTPGGFNPEPI